MINQPTMYGDRLLELSIEISKLSNEDAKPLLAEYFRLNDLEIAFMGERAEQRKVYWDKVYSER